MNKENYKKFIKNDIATYSKDIDILRNLIRYQNVHRNVNESVAEHSFYVAAFVLKLREYYNFNLESALKLALIHDLPESSISDVPHTVKKSNPDLSDALEKAELRILKEKMYNEGVELISNFNKGNTPEGLVCQLADILSVVLYANAELKSGNQVFNYIAIKAIERCKDVMNQLDIYRNVNYTKNQLFNKINRFVAIY